MDVALTDPPTEEKPLGQAEDTEGLPDREVVLEEFNSRFKASRDHYSEWRTEARTLYDMAAGRQWDATDEAALKDALRPMVTFNVSGKYMDAVTGLQINNRQDIRYYPREPGDTQVNELLTGAVSWGRDLCDQADDETDAFYDCVLVGYGCMEGYLDKDLEPSGVPAGMRVDPLEVYPDPTARKRNLEDRRYDIRIKWVDAKEYEDLVPEASDSPDMAELAAEEEDILTVIEEPQDYQTPGTTDTRKKGLKPVADYQFWERETAYQVQVQGLGATTMEEQEWAYYEPMLKQAKRPYEAKPIKRKVYYKAIIAGGTVRELGRSPYQGGFTRHYITGKRDRNKGTWFGIGRAILDPQRWVNKFFSSILWTLMTNSKGGLIAEQDAFPDARKAESTWASSEAITWVNSGALGKGKIQPKEMARYPEGMDRLMSFSLEALPQTSGLNVELLGLADRVQAGVVEAQRKQSAMAIIAWAFDAMRRYYKSMGRQQAAYVRDYMPEGTLVLINGEQSKQYAPLVKQRLSGTFDVIVDEAPTSVNMKERVWAVLENLIPQLLQAGMQIPPEVLDYSPIPADLAQKWKQAMQPDPKKQQIDEQMVMSTLRKMVSEAMKNETQSQLNTAKAQEAGASAQLKGVQAIETAAHAGAAQAQHHQGTP